MIGLVTYYRGCASYLQLYYCDICYSTVICDIVLTNRFGGGSVGVWLMCNWKGVGSDTTVDWGPWCKCSCLVENQSKPIK